MEHFFLEKKALYNSFLLQVDESTCLKYLAQFNLCMLGVECLRTLRGLVDDTIIVKSKMSLIVTWKLISEMLIYEQLMKYSNMIHLLPLSIIFPLIGLINENSYKDYSMHNLWFIAQIVSSDKGWAH